jgi:hypothetical protein
LFFDGTAMANEKSISMLRDGQPDGINNKSNLKDWSDYAKGNSFSQTASKAQSRHGLSADGCKAELKGDWSDDWQQPQKDSEGRGWRNPISQAKHLHRQGRF